MRQQANTAIVNLINSDEFKRCIQKVQPDYLREDLVSEVSLILLETNPDKIVMLSNAKQLTFYAVRIILNQAFSNSSPFYKKYRKHTVNYVDDILWEPVMYDANNPKRFCEMQKDLYIYEDSSDKNIKLKKDIEKVMFEIEREDKIYEVLDFYETEMLKLYLKCKTFREMERITHIPYVSCFHTIKKAINKLKNKVL